MKPMQNCKKCMLSNGHYTYHLINYHKERFSNEFMVSLARLKCSSIQHYVCVVNFVPIYSKKKKKMMKQVCFRAWPQF